MPSDSAKRGTNAWKGEWFYVSPLPKEEIWNSTWLDLDHYLESAGSLQDQPRKLKYQGNSAEGRQRENQLSAKGGQRKCETGMAESKFWPLAAGGTILASWVVKSHCLLAHRLPHFSVARAMIEWLMPILFSRTWAVWKNWPGASPSSSLNLRVVPHSLNKKDFSHL